MVKICELCGKRPAKYVCQECGRMVCEFCFDPTTWLCRECRQRLSRERLGLEAAPPTRIPWPTPMKLFLLGFALAVVGVILLTASALLSGAPASTGTVILIGPIPIILGAGPYSHWVLLLAGILTALGVLLFIFLRRWASG